MGINLQCVGCKAKRSMTLAEASEVTCQPCCAKCGMPEVVISASVSSRRTKKDLREVFK